MLRASIGADQPLDADIHMRAIWFDSLHEVATGDVYDATTDPGA